MAGGGLTAGGNGTLPGGFTQPSAPATGYQGTNWAGALGQEEANYQNVVQGYHNTLATQQANQEKIQQGYNTLGQNVMGTIQGISQSQAQAIRDAYAQQSGQASQQMVSSGLGNSTVQQSVQRGLTLDEQKAQIALANQTAQLTAGYQSQLGMAGLNYQNQAVMQNSALAGQGLNSMQGNINQFSGIYGHLAGQEQQLQFQAQQAAAERAQRQQMFQAQLNAQQQRDQYGGIANAYRQGNQNQGLSRFGAQDPYLYGDQGSSQVSNVMPATGYSQSPTSYQAPGVPFGQQTQGGQGILGGYLGQAAQGEAVANGGSWWGNAPAAESWWGNADAGG